MEHNTDRILWTVLALAIGVALYIGFRPGANGLLHQVMDKTQTVATNVKSNKSDSSSSKEPNLLADTSSELTVDDSNTRQGWRYGAVYTNLIPGSVYTFSSDVSVVGAATSISVKVFNPTTGRTIDTDVLPFPIINGKISGSVKPTDGYTQLIVYAGNSGNTYGNKVTFHHMKLKKTA